MSDADTTWDVYPITVGNVLIGELKIRSGLGADDVSTFFANLAAAKQEIFNGIRLRSVKMKEGDRFSFQGREWRILTDPNIALDGSNRPFVMAAPVTNAAGHRLPSKIVFFCENIKIKDQP